MTFEVDDTSLRCARESDPVQPLLASVYAQLFERIRDSQLGAEVVYGPNRRGDDHPAARRLGALSSSWDWVAITWRAWSLWDVHLGLVPCGTQTLAVGVHYHDSVADRMPLAVVELAEGALEVRADGATGERQIDLLTLAWSCYPRVGAANLLVTAMVDLATVLGATLAPHPTTKPTLRSPHAH